LSIGGGTKTGTRSTTKKKRIVKGKGKKKIKKKKKGAKRTSAASSWPAKKKGGRPQRVKSIFDKGNNTRKKNCRKRGNKKKESNEGKSSGNTGGISVYWAKKKVTKTGGNKGQSRGRKGLAMEKNFRRKSVLGAGGKKEGSAKKGGVFTCSQTLVGNKKKKDNKERELSRAKTKKKRPIKNDHLGERSEDTGGGEHTALGNVTSSKLGGEKKKRR